MDQDKDLSLNEQKAVAKGEGSLAINAAAYANVTVYQYVTYDGGKVSVRESTDPAYCPYPGLETFRTSEAKFFTGREDDVADLENKLREHNICGVIAASGAGKSSLVHAGLIPVLASREHEVWDVFAFKPGSEPLYGLARSMSGVLAEANSLKGQFDEIDDTVKDLRENPGRLRRYIEEIINRKKESAEGKRHHVLIFIDQWEELYTRENENDHDVLIRELIDVVGSGLAKVILTMRIDFMEELVGASTQFFNVLEPAVRILRPLSETGRRAAIERPAEVAGLGVPSELTSRLIADLGRSEGTLPYLQFALRQLWEKRDQKINSLTVEAYNKMEGLTGAIGKHADDVFSKLTTDEQYLAKRILPRLVNVSESGALTSRRLPFADFDGAARTLLRKLAEADRRLIVLSSATEAVAEAEIVAEVAHEALLHDWKMLSDWISEREDFYRLRNKLETDAKTWVDENHALDLKINEGRLLVSATSLLKETKNGELSERCVNYIKFSLRNSAQARRRRIFARGFTLVLLVLSLVGIIFTYVNQGRIVAERYEQNREDLFRAADRSENHENIAKFALATWPRSIEDKNRTRTSRALDLLSGSIPWLFASKKIVLPRPVEIKELIPSIERAVVYDSLRGILLVDTKNRTQIINLEQNSIYADDYKLDTNGASLLTWSSPHRDMDEPKIQLRSTYSGDVIYELSGVQIVAAFAVSKELARAVVLDQYSNTILLDLEKGQTIRRVSCPSREDIKSLTVKTNQFATGAFYMPTNETFIYWTNYSVCKVDREGNAEQIISTDSILDVERISETEGFLVHYQSSGIRYLAIYRSDGSFVKQVSHSAKFDYYAINNSRDKLILWNDTGLFRVLTFDGNELRSGDYQKSGHRLSADTDVASVAVHAKFFPNSKDKFAIWANGNPVRVYSVENIDEMSEIFPKGRHVIGGPLVTSELSSTIFWSGSGITIHDTFTGITRHSIHVSPLDNELFLDESTGQIHQIVGDEFRTINIFRFLNTIVIGNKEDRNSDAVISPDGEWIAYWTQEGIGTFYNKGGEILGNFNISPKTFPKFDELGAYFQYTDSSGNAVLKSINSKFDFKFFQFSDYDENKIVHTERGIFYSTTNRKGNIEIYYLPQFGGNLSKFAEIPFDVNGISEYNSVDRIRSSFTLINKSATRLIRQMSFGGFGSLKNSVVVEVWDLEKTNRIYFREFAGYDILREIALDSSSNTAVVQLPFNRLIALDLQNGKEAWDDTELVGSRPMIISDLGILLYRSDNSLVSVDLASGDYIDWYTFTKDSRSQTFFAPPERWVVSADKKLLLVWNDQRASILSTNGLQPLSTLRAPHGRLKGASFTNGLRLVTWSEDNSTRVWDVESGVQLDVYSVSNLDYSGATASANGSTSMSWKNASSFETGSNRLEIASGVAIVFDLTDLESGSVFEVACSRLNDNDFVAGGPDFAPNLPLSWNMLEICLEPKKMMLKPSKK